MPAKEEPAAGYDFNSVEPGVWRFAIARRASLVVDGENYFALMQQAMLNARRRILLIGWDFDTRIHLSQGRRWWQKGQGYGYPSRLGSFILWLARHRKGLEIRILKWSFGVIKFAGRGSMAIDLARWWPHRRIDFKFDTAHPIGCSHHQKIVVIDDAFAVCGGIDMTARRWDTREHVENDRRRKQPGGSPYDPWHDCAMLMEGDVAATLGELGRARWNSAGGKPLPPITPCPESAWPEGLQAQFENVEIGIARTRAEYGGDPPISEIERLFVSQIHSAKKFIYAENQYFASRVISEAMAQRLAEDNPPEIVIVHPETADGWVESKVMDPARARLVTALREIDRAKKLHLFVPYSGAQSIYVHAKLLIVDDRILRVGSANFNNRSMGLDSECDVFIDCARPANAHCSDAIRSLRISLLAEHCGVAEEEMAEALDRTGSMADAIAGFGEGRSRHLRPFVPDPPTEAEAALAEREVFDPEEPAEMFAFTPRGRGLFRSGTLLARARKRMRRKQRDA